MEIITVTNRNEYLSTKDKYYIAGWVDGEQDAIPQVFSQTSGSMFDKPAKLYFEGYTNAKDNEFTMGGR